MPFLHFLEEIRIPPLTWLFSALTYAGGEIAFFVVAMIILWCGNKRTGYYVLVTGLFGVVLNQFMKIFFRIPRPWVADPSLHPVASAVPGAEGYSFPSGHTQNAVGLFGSLAVTARNRRVRGLLIALTILIPFSRMYLGVHTPLDVGVAFVCGWLLVFLLRGTFRDDARYRSAMPYIIAAALTLCAALFVYVFFVLDREGVDEYNLGAAMKNSATLLGCVPVLPIAYIVDEKYLRFDTRGRWYVQIIKTVAGLALVILIKLLMPYPLEALTRDYYVSRAVTYFLMMLFACVLYPMLFPYVSKIKVPVLDRLGERASRRFVCRRTASAGESANGENNGETDTDGEES